MSSIISTQNVLPLRVSFTPTHSFVVSTRFRTFPRSPGGPPRTACVRWCDALCTVTVPRYTFSAGDDSTKAKGGGGMNVRYAVRAVVACAVLAACGVAVAKHAGAGNPAAIRVW